MAHDPKKRNPAGGNGGGPENTSVLAGHPHVISPTRVRPERQPVAPTFSWRITWKREGWLKEQVRHFEREFAARKHLDKLLGDGRPDLAPLAVVRLERRPVGSWREVQS